MNFIQFFQQVLVRRKWFVAMICSCSSQQQTLQIQPKDTLLLQNPSGLSSFRTSVVHLSFSLFCWGENYPPYLDDTEDLWYVLLYQKVENTISKYPSCSVTGGIYKTQGLCHSPYYWAVQLHLKVVPTLLNMG